MFDSRVAFSLQGRTALVTGASSGIGLQIARTFASAGARVVLAARRVDRLQAAVEALKENGHDALALPLDVTDTSGVARALDAAEAGMESTIDILFNNAGVIHVERFLNQEDEQIRRTFETNLLGAFAVAREVARRMVAHGGGSIINVASTAGLRASGHLSSYGASKAALIHLTQTMALELASKGVRVNALAPGNFETDMHIEFESAGFDASIQKRIPMGRFGAPAELDGAALLLASQAGSYITGAVLPVDGGQLLSWM